MIISSNDSFQRRISKAFVHLSLWNNFLIKRSLNFLKQHPRLFSVIIVPIQHISEGYEFEVFKKIVKSDMTVLDIGANVGLYTLKASRLVGNKGRVIAFEPDKFNLRMLKKRIKNTNYKNILLEKVALSNKKGQQKFFIDSVNPGNHSFGEKNIYKKQCSVLVPTITLDEYIKSKKIGCVDFIKIDVQGAEKLVLSGAVNLLKHQPVTIMMEYWPKGIRNVGQDPEKLLLFLSDCGFNFRVIDKEKKKLYSISLSALIADSRGWKNPTDYTNLILSK